MNRRNLIKNSLMALAVSFLPKILQPSVPEISEEVVNVKVQLTSYVIVDGEIIPLSGLGDLPQEHVMQLKKSTYEYFLNWDKASSLK